VRVNNVGFGATFLKVASKKKLKRNKCRMVKEKVSKKKDVKISRE